MDNVLDGTNPWRYGTPVTVSPVFTRSQQILPASVIGMLKKQPVSIKHIAGMDVIVVKAIIDWWTVFSKLHHLSTKVSMLIDPHSMRTLMLKMKNIANLISMKWTVVFKMFLYTYIYISAIYHLRYHTTGPDTVVKTHPLLVIGVFPSMEKVLVTHKVWPFIHHPAPTFYLNGVAAAEMGVQISTVNAALIGAALKVSVLIKDNL